MPVIDSHEKSSTNNMIHNAILQSVAAWRLKDARNGFGIVFHFPSVIAGARESATLP